MIELQDLHFLKIIILLNPLHLNYLRYEKGKDYPIYTRKKESLDSKEELLFDCNIMAKDHSYFRLVGLSVSPNNQSSMCSCSYLGITSC